MTVCSLEWKPSDPRMQNCTELTPIIGGCVVLGADPSVNGRQSESITTTALNSCHFVRFVSSPSSDKWFVVPNVHVNMFPWQWSFQG